MMINLKNIQYQISQKPILQNINLNIQEGKTTIIMGKNGSGKSTLLRLLNQIIKPSSGFFSKGTSIIVTTLSTHDNLSIFDFKSCKLSIVSFSIKLDTGV